MNTVTVCFFFFFVSFFVFVLVLGATKKFKAEASEYNDCVVTY
jgi:hypothetical protein